MPEELIKIRPTGVPILPSSKTNPIGQSRLVDTAMKRIRAISKRTQDDLVQWLESVPTRVIEVSSSFGRFEINTQRYEYLISGEELRAALERAKLQMDQSQIAMIEAAIQAYENGTVEAIATLSRLTDDYPRTVTSVISSEPWQRRVSLVRARVFEQMESFSGDLGKDLARVLGDSMDRGINPRDAARLIRDRFDVSDSRAERIARSEIPMAARRGRWDEDEDAEVNLGIRTKEMHLSALSPTTRQTHADRHGKLFTREEVKEWYSVDANGINCKCSTAATLVDESGQPFNQKFVDRIQAQRS